MTKDHPNVYRICQRPTIFTLAEANALLPLIDQIGKRHDQRINKLLQRQRYFVKTFAPKRRIEEIDDLVIKELQIWKGKILKLGVIPLQGGYYGFDSGFGYYSYYPTDPEVCHYHDYSEPPMMRRRLTVIRPIKGGAND